MKTDYVNKINDTLKELSNVSKQITKIQRSRRVMKRFWEIKVFQNYAVILAYGCIENLTKNIVADYYKPQEMPIRCQSFAQSLLDSHYSLSVKKETINKFLKKDCSTQWFDELKMREKENIKDRKYHKYTITDMNTALDFIFNERCKFAHGESTYTGTIQELIKNFKISVAWLYELDRIVNDKNLKG